uniref:Uncharacterized protein n=1 Tax=Nicotiana tabacum TaxID=4097 RepID=A0A1S4CQE2_TOBAC|nr:PREDICTED: uncharacterized protein LOC107821531 [Nicotiana tabacum]
MLSDQLQQNQQTEPIVRHDGGIDTHVGDNNEGIDLFVKHQPKLAPHISSYTNTDIVSQLKDKLTPDQFQQFGNTCFGSFLQMKRFDVQHQLFRCFMARQLNGTPNNVFAVYVNGQDTDDFSPTPNLQSKKKHVESVGPSSSPPHRRSRNNPKFLQKNQKNQKNNPPVCLSDIGHKVVHDHQLPEGQNEDPSSLRKDLKSFKEYVVGEFKSLRTLINDNFKMLSDQLQQNQQTEPIVRHDGGIDTDVGDNNEV